MKTRILLSLIIVPLLAFFIFYNDPNPFVWLAFAALSYALFEVYTMLSKKGLKPYFAAGILFGIAIYAITAFKYPKMYYMSAWAVFMLGLFTAVIFTRDVNNFTRIGATALPLMYISTLGLFGIELRLMEQGYYYIFLLFLLTLVYDGGAYFAGSFLGKRKLIPEISPGKSVEGCIGGIIVNAVTVTIIFYAWLPEDLFGSHTLLHLLVLSVLLSVTGQLGDLAASVIKRYTGSKNSSNLLPELGGVLDKIDSALFNAPVLYFYIKYIAGITL